MEKVADIWRDVLEDADVICCTLSGAGSTPILEFTRGASSTSSTSTSNSIYSSNSSRFTCVIVDEAAQAVEPSILIPLRYVYMFMYLTVCVLLCMYTSYYMCMHPTLCVYSILCMYTPYTLHYSSLINYLFSSYFPLIYRPRQVSAQVSSTGRRPVPADLHYIQRSGQE